MKLITANKSTDGNWYINISHSGNGKTVADGGEGYVSKGNVKRAMRKNWEDGYKLELVRDLPLCIQYRMVPRA